MSAFEPRSLATSQTKHAISQPRDLAIQKKAKHNNNY